MLITIPTTSTNLTDALTTEQTSVILNGSRNGNRECIIQNLGSTNIFVDFNTDATILGGIKIPTNDTISFNVERLDKINLISDTSDNVNVRVSVTS